MAKLKKSSLDCAARLRALADGSRLSILRQLMSGTKCVHQLNTEIKIEQSLLSHHLKTLKSIGLVESERVGKEVQYRLTRQARSEINSNGLDLGCCSVQFK